MAKAESLKKLAFGISLDNKLFLPERLHDFKYGQDIVKTLRSLNFEDKSKGSKNNLLFITDINSDLFVELNPHNFQIVSKHTSLVKNPRFGFGVIVLENNISEVDQDLLISRLEKINNLLTYESPLYIFVKNDGGFNKNNVKPFFEKETKIIKGELKFYPNQTETLSVFETRKIKKTKKTKINLLSFDGEGRLKYPWAFYMFENLIEDFKFYGCHIINPKDSKLYESLINCKNARQAFVNLSDGNGIKYISSCGCIYERQLNGTESKIKDCHQDYHSILPEKIDWFDRLIKDICDKKVEKDLFCLSCGENLERHGRLINKYPDKSASILFNTYCPHCGSDYGDFKEKRKYFKIDKLLKEWNSIIESKIKKNFKE